MFLLGAEAADPLWERVLTVYGPLGLFSLAVGAFLWRWANKYAEAHLGLVDTIQKSVTHHDQTLSALTTSTLALTEDRKQNTETQQKIVETQLQLATTAKDIQQEVSKQRELTQKIGEQIEKQVLIGIRTDTVNMPGDMPSEHEERIRQHEASLKPKPR